MSLREASNKVTELIISCWDENQECDKNGKPLDNLTFDERLEQKIKSLEDTTEKQILEDAKNW